MASCWMMWHWNFAVFLPWFPLLPALGQCCKIYKFLFQSRLTFPAMFTCKHMFIPQLGLRSNARLTRGADSLCCVPRIVGTIGGGSCSCSWVVSTLDLGMMGCAMVHYANRFPRDNRGALSPCSSGGSPRQMFGNGGVPGLGVVILNLKTSLHLTI